MNIKQLRNYLDTLLDTGIDPHTPVCIAANSEASEVEDITIMNGPFREDPSPKMSAFRHSMGLFVFLETCDDYEWIKPVQYLRVEGPVAPTKEFKPD